MTRIWLGSIVLISCIPIVSAAPMYHATPIDLGANYNGITAVAVNSSGTVLVTAEGPGAHEDFDEYVWSPSQSPMYIPWIGQNNLLAHGLTDDDTVIAGPCIGNADGFTILTGAPQYPRLDGDTRAINNSHQVVGGFLDHVASWDGSTHAYSDLGAAGGGIALPTAINESGVIVGIYGITPNYDLAQQTDFPFLLDHGNLIHLPGLPGSPTGQATPIGVNDNGIVVGAAELTANHYVPVYWQNDQLFQLPLPPDSPTGAARDINASGEIVGYSQDTAGVWIDGVFYDLNQVNDLGNLNLSTAVGINDSGQIIANGFDDNFNETAWLLTPITVPEPTSLVALCASSILLLRRRSRRRL
jgi:uncharacterized membrane protein